MNTKQIAEPNKPQSIIIRSLRINDALLTTIHQNLQTLLGEIGYSLLEFPPIQGMGAPVGYTDSEGLLYHEFRAIIRVPDQETIIDKRLNLADYRLWMKRLTSIKEELVQLIAEKHGQESLSISVSGRDIHLLAKPQQAPPASTIFLGNDPLMIEHRSHTPQVKEQLKQILELASIELYAQEDNSIFKLETLKDSPIKDNLHQLYYSQRLTINWSGVESYKRHQLLATLAQQGLLDNVSLTSSRTKLVLDIAPFDLP